MGYRKARLVAGTRGQLPVGSFFDRLRRSKPLRTLSKDDDDQPRIRRQGRASYHVAVRLGADDTVGRERLAQYMLRCPVSLQRMIRVTDQGQVLYVAEKKSCRRLPKPASADLFGDVPRNFQVLDPLDFIAEFTQHLPDARKHLTRSFGWYSNKSRGMRAKADGEHRHAAEIDQQHTPRPHLARRRWAALIKRVYEVDPLSCRRFGGQMRIVSFIEPSELDVMQKIHRHCRLWEQSSRAPPQGRGHEQALGELRYESGLEFVDEPAPNEPIWFLEQLANC